MPVDGYDITGCEDPKDALCRTSSSTVNASLSGILMLAVLLAFIFGSFGLGPEIEGGAIGSLVPGCINDSSMIVKAPLCTKSTAIDCVRCKGDVGHYLNLIASSDLP